MWAPNEMRNIDIVKLICKELGKTESTLLFADRKGQDMRYAIDPGQDPQASSAGCRVTRFADAHQKKIDWYLGNREWWETIIAGEYQN
jgi:dTDP-glucose 4,6-dehydratase